MTWIRQSSAAYLYGGYVGDKPYQYRFLRPCLGGKDFAVATVLTLHGDKAKSPCTPGYTTDVTNLPLHRDDFIRR